MRLNLFYTTSPYHITGSPFFHNNLYGSVSNEGGTIVIPVSSNMVFNSAATQELSNNIVWNNAGTQVSSNDGVWNDAPKR